MTLKEIAALANVGRSTVQSWIQAIAENKQDLAEIWQGILLKSSKARLESKAADYDLNETIAIIKAGGNETLANLLAENAFHRETAPEITGNDERITRLENLVEKMIVSIPAMIAQTVQALNRPAVQSLPGNIPWEERAPDWLIQQRKRKQEKEEKIYRVTQTLPFGRKK